MATLHPKSVETDKKTHFHSEAETSDARSSWDRLESEIKVWNERLEDLKKHADTVGREVVNDLERRYQDIQKEMDSLRNEFSDKAASSIEQTSSTMRESSQDLFEGMTRAWQELKTGFENAASRIKRNNS